MSELKTHAEIIAFINELEDKFPVNDWKADDIHIWPLIRINIFFLIFKSGSGENKSSDKPIPSKAKVNRVSLGFFREKLKAHFTYRKTKLIRFLNKHFIIYIRNYIFYKQLYAPAQVLFFSLSASRTLILDQWYNKQVDPIQEFFTKNSVSSLLLEMHNGAGYKIPRFYEHLTLGFETEITLQINNAYKDIEHLKIDLNNYDDFIKYIEEAVKDVSFDKISKNNLSRLIKYCFAHIPYIKKVLVRKKTKLCLVTCYYDSRMFAVCVAARQLGIPVIDIQHGVQGEHHVAYGRWNNVPVGGYQLMPTIFWCWSDLEAASIRKWAAKNTLQKVIVGGNPWINMWKDNTLALVQLYDKQVDKIKVLSKEAVHILYSMQPIANALPDFIVEAIAQSPANWKWWIRTHPRQQLENEEIHYMLSKKCDKSKYDIDQASRIPLPALLRHTQVHVTNWSSVVLEAQDFGVPSVLIHMNGRDIYKNQLLKGIAVFADSENSNNVIFNIQSQLNYDCRASFNSSEADMSGILNQLLKFI